MRLGDNKECMICDFCSAMHCPDPTQEGVRDLGEPVPLNCPVCGISLVHAAAGGERIFYCSQCRGMLIPMDAFVTLIQNIRAHRDNPRSAPVAPNWKGLERQINCPQCNQRMDTHLYGGAGNIIIDDCERCSLNWLDDGELQRIVSAPDHQYTEGV